MGWEYGWLLAGGTAFTGLIALTWQYLSGFYQQLKGHLITTINVDSIQARAVACYLRKYCRRNMFAPRDFVGYMLYIKSSRRNELVVLEYTTPKSSLYWLGIWPIYITTDKDAVKTYGYTQHNKPLTMSFIRGTFDPVQVMIKATTEFNIIYLDHSDQKHRHTIYHMTGTVGKMLNTSSSRSGNSGEISIDGPTSCDPGPDYFISMTPLSVELSDIGRHQSRTHTALSRLAHSADVLEVIEHIKNWYASEDWYKTHGIPWRLGCLFNGQTGTGKSATIRAVAEDLDLPVFVFDLATFLNSELRDKWHAMLSSVPCVAVIEDIDNAFHGREPQFGNQGHHLTFDCLLNCMDGLDCRDGILLFVTTNQLDHVDPAISQRPGRIDYCVEMRTLDESGREKIAGIILSDWPHIHQTVVDSGYNETGAEFQQRCIQIACDLQLKKVATIPKNHNLDCEPQRVWASPGTREYPRVRCEPLMLTPLPIPK